MIYRLPDALQCLGGNSERVIKCYLTNQIYERLTTTTNYLYVKISVYRSFSAVLFHLDALSQRWQCAKCKIG